MLFFSSIIMLLFVCVIRGKEPISIKESSTSIVYQRPAIIAAASAALGIGGKFLLDGPVFNDPVSLAGMTAVITGGNTGLGKETASKLYSLGANTIILCRDSRKAQNAIDDIMRRRNSLTKKSIENSLSFKTLDLTSLKQIEECAATLKRDLDRIDILVNNAGVMAIPSRELTLDGFEKHIGINHLGHYALTGHLLGLLQKSPASRVISVSSAAHLLADKDISSNPNLILSKPNYEPWTAYGNSKLANILFTKKLAALLPRNITPLVCHPGGCRTELGRYIFDPESLKDIPPYAVPFAALAAAPLLYFTKSSEQGAQTQIYLSASKDISTADRGCYYDNSAKTSASELASNPDLADWLWAASERLTGVKYSI